MNSEIETPRRNLTGAIVPALAAAALAGLGAMYLVGLPDQRGATGAPPGCILNNLDTVGGPLALLDVNGQAVTQSDLASAGPSVLYFGFTHCPDVCPTALYALGAALSAPDGYDIQPVMVSLDPERDTPEIMDSYSKTDGFPAGLVGLTGSTQQVAAAARAYGVQYRKAPIEGDPDAYNVDHTSFFYIVDEKWKTRGQMISFGATPESINACISAALAER